MDKANVVEKVCRNCGRKYEDEMFKLAEQGRLEGKAFGGFLNKFLPKKFKEEMDAYIRKLIELTDGLCPKCMEEATKSLVPPSPPTNINDYR